MREDADLALERIEPLDVGAAEVRLEDLVLDRLQAGLERVDDREVAVDDGVEQGVEDERRPVPEEVRLALGTAAHTEEVGLRAVAYREHDVRADEDVDLADQQLAVGADFHRMQDGEQFVVVLLDLRPLVAVPCVLDGEIVQAELRLHLGELVLRGVLQRHPDEAAGPGDELADVVDRAIGELAAVLVGDAVDQHVAASPEQKTGPILEAGRNRDEHREGESR